MFIGVMLRYWPPCQQSVYFLHDGGLHLRLAEELLSNGFRLPAYTAYNQLATPFAYPPLSTYLVASMHQFFAIEIATILRFLPAAISCLAVYAFFQLSTELLEKNWQQIVATAVYAFIPSTFCQLIKSGGISRSCGALFCILALREVIRISSGSRRQGAVARLAILIALTELSHPEWAISLSLFLLSAVVSNRACFFWLFKAFLIALLIAAPWWIFVITLHGLGPFAAAALSSPAPFDLSSLLSIKFFPVALNFLLPTLAVIGFGVCLVERKFLFPLFVAAVLVLQGRGFGWMVSIPFAIFVAIGLDWAIKFGIATQQTSLGAALKDDVRRRIVRVAGAIVMAYALCDGLWMLAPGRPELQSASPAMLRSFDWIRSHTNPSAKFLVLTGRVWWFDYVNELFPALTGRRSETTCQGREWLSDGAFQNCVQLVSTLGAPYAPSNAELARQVLARRDINYILVEKSFISRVVLDSLISEQYSLVYQDDENIVYEHSAV